MYATAEGTARYADRFPHTATPRSTAPSCGLEVSSLGIGTYLGATDDAADRGYTEP